MLILTIIVVVQVVVAVWLLEDLLKLATGFYNLFEKDKKKFLPLSLYNIFGMEIFSFSLHHQGAAG